MANSDRQLSGKIAIVTGAVRNQGRAYAEMLASHGCRGIVVHYRGAGSQGEAEETAESLKALGAESLLVQGDLAKVEDVQRMFAESHAKFGQLDILINNAGVVVKKPFVDITEEDYDRAFGINAKAAFFCMQEAAKQIMDGGRIVNIGTTLVGATTGFYAIYAGSKAPLEHFSRALAKEIGHRGVTVNTIAPGPVNTSFFFPAETPESVEFLKHMSPQNRLAEVEEIVPLVEFLVSPKGGWITGQTIFINGGFLAR